MNEIFDKILAWFDSRFEDGESEDLFHKRIVETVVAQYTTKDELKNELSEFLTSLQQEQPVVDLKKEYDEYVSKDPVYSKLVNGIAGFSIAKHFFELGLKTGKEENK